MSTLPTASEISPLVSIFRRRGFGAGVRLGEAVWSSGPDGVDREIETARTGAAFFDRHPRGRVVAMLGSDRLKFLHGQCTQEIKSKLPGQGGAAWLLDAQGRNLGSLRFCLLDDHVQAEVEPRFARATVERFDRFIITEDVRARLPATPPPVFHVAGPRCREALAAAFGACDLPAGENEVTTTEFGAASAIIVGNRESGFDGFDVRLFGGTEDEAERLAAALENAGSRAAGDDAFEVLRLEAGRPRYGVDVLDDVLPAEAGRLSDTTSFTKGCYAGQEVVAKQQYMGKPRKLVAPVFGSAQPPPHDSALRTSEGTEVGRTRSFARSNSRGLSFGFALLKPAFGIPGTTLVDDAGGAWSVGPSPAASI